MRRICLALPDTFEKLSHGEPTFFTKKGVFAMFSNNHHHDGHVAVFLPVSPGQEALIDEAPATYYRPPSRRFDAIWGQTVAWLMADLKVRQLDNQVTAALRARAGRKGVSLEEEIRTTLAASVDARRRAFLCRAKAVRAAIGDGSDAPALDSVRLIRKERDRRD